MHVIDRIVDAIDPRPGQSVVEIGPGLGALTQRLIARANHITAIEIDRDLAQRLRERFDDTQLCLIESDALKVDWASIPGTGLRVVGNLPYNVSTPLLFTLLPVAHRVADQHFMLQREVVDRMVAEPGSKDYGRLSVMLQMRYRMQRLFHVMPGSFTPVPKVQSSIVRMVPLATHELPEINLEAFAKVVTAAFGQRRKTLRNALSGLLNDSQLAQSGIDPGCRAETLNVADFVNLTQTYARVCAG